MDGAPPPEEDFSQIPIIERSQHKVRGVFYAVQDLRLMLIGGQNWKARVSAYTDVVAKAAKTASDTDPFFRPYVSDGQLL